MNPWGGNAAGYGEAQNIVGNVNQGQARPGQARTVKCYNSNGAGHIARNCTKPKRPKNFKYFKDKMLLMQATDELLFLVGCPDNAFDDDVDEQPVQVLALNANNVFQAEDYDAFDSDVDEAPIAQTMIMANLSSADPITDEAGPSYDLDILSEMTSADDIRDASLKETKVMVVKGKLCKPFRGIKVSTSGSASAGSILRRLSSVLKSSLSAADGLAGKVHNIKGKIRMPVHNVSFIRPLNDIANAQHVEDGSNKVQSVEDDSQHDGNVHLETNTMNDVHGHSVGTTSFASVLQHKNTKKKVVVSELRNDERVEGAAVVIPMEVVKE
nr:hypothetical protein [Tanacetum cinerariifolium]